MSRQSSFPRWISLAKEPLTSTHYAYDPSITPTPADTQERIRGAMHTPPARAFGPSRPTEQVQTGLLVLPVDIRRLIFDYLIAGPGVCIDENGRRAIGKEVSASYRNADGSRLVTCHHRHVPVGKTIDVLYLMLVCRQLYDEVTDVLYMTSHFIFHDAIAFLRFCSPLPPHLLQKIRSITFEAGNGGSSFLEYPLRFWSDIEKGHEDAHCLPPAAAEYYNQPYYPSLISRCLREPRYHHDVKNPQVPSTWGAVCQDLEKMIGLRVLNVIVALESMSECKKHGRFDDESGLKVDHGQAEPFILQPLIAVKRALGCELELSVMMNWVALGSFSKLEQVASGLGVIVKRAKLSHSKSKEQ